MHPRSPVTGREVEDCVRNQKAMLCTGLEQKQTVAVAVTDPMLPDHSFPGDAVTANSRIKLTKHDEFVSMGNSGDDGVQVFVKLVLGLIWVSHGRGIGADNGDELPSTTEGESHRHKAIIHTLWGTS